ncbi:hypothetical protein UA70_17910, partial [Raoultella planticola]
MSQQDAARQQANTRNNIRVVSIFTAAAIGLIGVLVILYAWQLPPFTRHSQFTDNAYVRGQTTFISPQVSGYVTAVNVQDFAYVKPGQVLFQIDDRIYKQRVHQAQATLAMKEAALKITCSSGYVTAVNVQDSPTSSQARCCSRLMTGST